MIIDVKNCLFHGIDYSVDGYESLTNIFKSRYIYTRESLKKYLGDYRYQKFQQKHSSNWNGKDAISIACHPSNAKLIDKYNLKRDNDDNAYEEYISGNIALVLDKSLLDEFEVKQSTWKMNYELQILGDIPIKYIMAIAFNFSHGQYTTKNLYNLKKILLELNNDSVGKYCQKYSELWYLLEDFEKYSVEELLYKKMYFLYKIKHLLKTYALDIPIIDLNYGYILPDETKQKQRLMNIQKLYSKYKENRRY